MFFIEILPDWEGERRGEKHEELGQHDGVGPHCQAMSGADGLRNDFP